ncbi:MAG: permease-like cell division protein FtsX [Lachnospiraceae bacterium]|nr:permease-like cell division protein FtsX [Lachnospiraceae bacterium]
MKFNSWCYNIVQGIKNISRNRMFSLASITTMTACLFLFGIFYSLSININSIVDQTEQSMCITVFFENDLPEITKMDIGRKISARSEVLRVDYISADEAWDNWKEKHFKGYESLVEGFKDENPLANSSSYQIYLKDISKQSDVVNYLKTIDGIRTVNSPSTAAEHLAQISVIVTWISRIIIGILLFGAIFLISNTISMGVTIRKEEIAIMKYIGATDIFVRAPFLVEGVIIGTLGSLIPLVIVYYVYDSVLAYMVEKNNLVLGNIQLVSIGEVFTVLIPVVIIIGVGIGFLGSYFTLRKQLVLIERENNKKY